MRETLSAMFHLINQAIRHLLFSMWTEIHTLFLLHTKSVHFFHNTKLKLRRWLSSNRTEYIITIIVVRQCIIKTSILTVLKAMQHWVP